VTGRLDRAVAALVPPFAMAAVGLARDGQAPRCHIATAPGLAATPDTMFRVASISKIVVGQVARQVLEAAGHGPDMAAEEALGFALRHPAAPERPIRVGALAAHHAGLTDAGGYLVPPGIDLADWIAAQGDAIWGPEPPGAVFRYCNLGYLLLAAVAERLAGDRFDHLAARLVLGPAGIAGGFNWSGVAPARRADHLPIFRRDATGLVPQIDTQLAPEGILGPDGAPALTGAYRLGRDVARLSPQGGLRLSLSGLLRLADRLRDAPRDWLWSAGDSPVDGPADLFARYGWGVQMLDDPAIYPRPLVGHFANAHGMVGGVWRDDAARSRLVYILNGLPMDDDPDDDRLRPQEAALLKALAQECPDARP